MEKTSGTLFAGDQTIPVTVTLWVVEEGDGLQAWSGGLLWRPEDHVEPRGRYRVQLDDGRAGELLLLYDVVLEGRPGAAFRGVGRLE